MRLRMIRLVILLLPVTTVAAEKTPGDSLDIVMPTFTDAWFAKDKADHFIVSALITGCAYYAARKEAQLSAAAGIPVAVGFSLSLGIFKEIYDGLSGKGSASFKDLGADALGVGLGYLLCTVGKK